MLLLLAWALLFSGTRADAAGQVTYESTKQLPDLHHAVGIALPGDWPEPRGLPLGESRTLVCSTCHGLREIEKQPYDRVDTATANFLRGGPYPKLEDFCFRCHDPRTFDRPNIHASMLERDGQIREETCLYCHEQVNRERNRPLDASDYRLRLPPETLCYGCHLKTPHFNAVEHQSSKPDEAMLTRIKSSMHDLGVILPLGSKGELMCSTCHTPHPWGVIDASRNPAGQQAFHGDVKEGVRYVDNPWSKVVVADKQERLDDLAKQTGQVFSLGYQQINREVLLRLPARDGSLCLACHEFEE
jgi:hypothetical protein